MTAYCVKCKTAREIQNAQPIINAKGTAYTQGTCAVCGTKLTRFGKTDAPGERADSKLPMANSEKKTESGKRKAESKKLKTENRTRASSLVTRHSSLATRLVIVESPAKARTIGKFLGAGYRVRASIGHIRDLPERQMGVEIENNFRPRYVIAPKKKDVVKELKADAQGASEIFLATDPDREGEAIAWHLLAALDSSVRGKPVRRVEFHEITRDAIERAFAQPRAIHQQLVDAQQARRVLDRIVGYTISPLLRKKINTKNLSAGRVQSVAVRLVVEREREINAFVPVEYWSIEAELRKQSTVNSQQSTDKTFRAKLM
ncbi:MAG: hypothetical protein HY070_10380, partial [Chloroflexi bacterium]|nr:hypothetical protein [Chloroflexota bacterium]